MTGHRDFVRYLAWSAGLIVVGAVLSMIFVVILDPYRIYGLIDIVGINHVKPALTRYKDEIKLAGARGVHANAFILGNSRSEIGLNPDFSGFSATGYSAYNLAISGTRAATARKQIAYLREVGQKPVMIILGVEFIDFLNSPPASHSVQSKEKSKRGLDAWEWKFNTIFSLTSVADALDTLQLQRKSEIETMTPRGFNPLLEYKKYAREEGYYALFQQRAFENVKSLRAKSRAFVTSTLSGALDMDEVRQILAENSSGKSELNIVIYPYHAQILLMFEQLGLWPAFEEWKRLLAEEVVSVKKMNPEARITLWDFSGFSNFHCEVIPIKGDKISTTKWYWEAGHFKPAFGDLVLTRILENPKESFKVAGMGFPLMPSNLDENRKRIEQERRACQSAYPNLFSEVKLLMDVSKDARQ